MKFNIYKTKCFLSTIFILYIFLFCSQKSFSQNQGIYDQYASFQGDNNGNLVASSAWLKSWKNSSGNVCDALLTYVISGATGGNGTYTLAIPFGNNIGYDAFGSYDQFWGNSGTSTISVIPTTPCGQTVTYPAQTITVTPTWSINSNTGSCAGLYASYTGAPVSVSIAAVTVTGTACPLPLKLSSFTATNSGNSVALNWVATSAVNVQNFEIEKSKDGLNFAKIGSQAINPSGQSESYGFTDKQPGAANYYRLKIIENSGAISYSKTVFVKSGSSTSVNILPNPATNFVVLEGSKQGATVLIYDALGAIKSNKILTNDNEVLDISNLSTGTYYLKITNNGSSTTKKLVVAK